MLNSGAKPNRNLQAADFLQVVLFEPQSGGFYDNSQRDPSYGNREGRKLMRRRSLMIHPSDGVVCVLEDAQKGDTVQLASGQEIVLLEDIEFAHKVCIRDMKAGEPVIK